MKICIDAGHGMSNRKPGVYDTGAVSGNLKESDIVLKYAHCLREACEALGLEVYMTRRATNDITPLGTRTKLAAQNGCTHLISVHVNQGDTAQAHGYETLYRTSRSLDFAAEVHALMVSALGLRDRGLKQRPDLAVLGHATLQSALLEFGFIDNAEDMAAVTDAVVMKTVCGKLARLLFDISRR